MGLVSLTPPEKGASIFSGPKQCQHFPQNGFSSGAQLTLCKKSKIGNRNGYCVLKDSGPPALFALLYPGGARFLMSEVPLYTSWSLGSVGPLRARLKEYM